MSKHPLFRALCWTMMLIFPVSIVLADNQAAMLQVAGAVKVNDRPVTRSYALFQGDKIVTGEDATAWLTARGISIRLAPNSQLTFEGSRLSVGAGGAQFATEGALSVVAGSMTIVPAASGARFEVVSRGKQIQVAARQGNLTIIDGKQSTILEAGKVLNAGRLPSAPSSKSSIIGGAGLIVGLIVAAGLAVGLGVALSDDSVSPTVP